MRRYIAFLRAINVGGHIVKMQRLRTLFEQLGLKGVETFIASGNVLFDSNAKDTGALERRIEKHLEKALGYETATFVRSIGELTKVLASHPFTEAERDAHSLWVGFLKESPGDEAREKLMSFQTANDNFHVHGREAYWLRHANTSESKISGSLIEKTLRMRTTFRNVTTVRRLAAKAPR